jgi:hypothetical protein
MHGKCPKCDSTIIAPLTVQKHNAVVPISGPTWHAITLNCPHCSAVLGASIAPIAIRTDILNAIKKR